MIPRNDIIRFLFSRDHSPQLEEGHGAQGRTVRRLLSGQQDRHGGGDVAVAARRELDDFM